MKLIVNANKVVLDEKDKLNAGEYNIHQVEFVFSEEYNNLVKKATFSTKNHSYLVDLPNGSCIIPYEVLEETGDFEIGAFGYETNGDDLVLRYSPSPTYVHVDLGSYRDNFDNYHVPTADVIEQLTERIENAEATVEGYDDRLTIAEDKLEGIEDGAEVNIIEDVKVNGTSLEVIDKSVNIPVPTKTSDLNNDSGYITNTVDDLTNYTKTGDMNTAINNAVNGEKELRQQADTNLQTQIDAITSSTDVVDVVGTYQELLDYDTSKLTDKDVIKVLQDSTHNDALSYYRWIITGGTGAWNYVGSEGPFYTKGETDTLLNTKQNTIDNSHKLSADYVDDTLTTNKFTSTSEKATWNAKYDKPSGGIPKTDLSSAVQTSLGKADTAIQDVSDKEDKSNKVTSITSSSTDTQYPSAKLLYDKLQEINDELYNNSEVSGTGETLTLNNTAESILKMVLYGNTSQYTTTGKNLLPYSLNSLKGHNTSGTWNNNIYTLNNLTFTINDDLTIKVNGTANAQTIFRIAKNPTISGTMVLNGCPSDGDYNKYFLIYSNNVDTSYRDEGSGVNITQMAGDNNTIEMVIRNSQALSNVLFKPMISTNGGDYEPYTNGASPNPSYPQPINVVSGDNTIKVEGENIFNSSWENKQIGSDGTISNVQYRLLSDYIQVQPNTKYYFSWKYTLNNSYLLYGEYDSSKTFIVRNAGNSSPTSFTTGATTKYIRLNLSLETNIQFNASDVSEVMLSLSNVPYSPYTSQTYPINLPVENLAQYDTNDYTSSALGSLGSFNITLDNSFNVKNGEEYYFSADIKLNSGTATTLQILRSGNVGGGGQDTNFISNPNLTSDYQRYISKVTFTQDVTLTQIAFQVTGQANNAVIEVRNLMISKYQSEKYYAYGTTPIELCKIGDYQDYFTKNSGKNLFNENIITTKELNGITAKFENGKIKVYGTASANTNLYWDFSLSQYLLNETLTLSYNGDISNIVNLGLKKGGVDKAIITPPNTSNTFIATQALIDDITTFSIWITSGKVVNATFNIQLELGSQATTYEPYGTNQWCKYNAIGKVVLDGTEDWGSFQVETSGLGRAIANDMENVYYDSNIATLLSDKLVGTKYSGSWNNTYECIATLNNNRFIAYLKEVANITEFKAKLSSGYEVIYALSSPYLSLIENETLQSQLDAIEKAFSYEGQTNVSQENNDLPFKLDLKAILDWRN